MLPIGLVILAVAVTVTSHSAPQTSATTDPSELTRLERVWNDAHLRGDVAAMESLFADELIVTVPEMPVMTRAEVLGFWRSGRATIVKYDTTGVIVRIFGEAAVVNGRLQRTRDFNGRVMSDDWQFTKTYVRRHGRWQVVAYHASTAPK